MLAAGIAFVSGILLAFATHLPPSFAISAALAAWIGAGCSLGLNSRTSLVVLFIAFAAVGSSIGASELDRIDPTRLKRQMESGVIVVEEPVIVFGIVASAPELAPDRILFELDSNRIQDRQVNRPATGLLQVAVLFRSPHDRNQFDEMRIEYGTEVRVSCQLLPPARYRNPGVVSLRSILDQKGLDATTLVKSPAYITALAHTSGAWVTGSLYHVRASAIATLLRRVRQPSSGLLVASIFGNQNFLDRRLAESFRAGGTYHLLVISGLHIALIASAMILILKNIARSRTARLSLTVLALWAFAMMVGAQPAVTRAASMISIAVLGQMILRRGSGANTLGASAILLLSWNPVDLYGPGFQLSFLTVLVMSAGTGPLYERLQAIGAWQPTEATPHPPRCHGVVRATAEVIFWNEREFRRESEGSRIHFRLEKASLARLERPNAFSWLLRSVFSTALTTIGIQIALLPVMVMYFHRVSLIAPLSNVIEAALLGILMLEGVCFLGVNALSTFAAERIAPAIEFSGDVIVSISSAIDNGPRASFRTPDYGEYSILVCGLYLAICVVWALVLSHWNPLSVSLARERHATRWLIRTRTGGLTAVTALMVWLVATHPFPPRIEWGRFTLTMLDVGQGDSMCLTFPSGSVMLLDSGGRLTFGDASSSGAGVFIEDRAGIGETAVAPYLWHLGIRRLDYIAATHGDADHIQGFVDVIPAFRIGRALKVPRVSAADNPFPEPLLRGRIAVSTLARGDHFYIDGVRLDVLAPFPDMLSPRFSANDRSLVLKINYGAIAILLTGDIEKRTEARLLEAGDDLRADVLKVAHHGSRTSTTQAFLDAVRPSFSLISAGSPSPFGHPHPDVVSRLEKNGGHILRTSACGAISISTDGRSITHRTFVKCDPGTLSR
jgi:competence protein ComEC